VKINFPEKFLGSGFYTGYIPFASGTFGSLAALAVYYIPGFEKLYIIIPAILLIISYGIFIAGKFEKVYGKDPSECTIDEVAGMWISLLFLPKNLVLSLLAFVIWRAMDILKPYPVYKLEELPGGWGIMLDDIAAAIYSLGIVHIIYFYVF
jgi:phosphatidylglycerophosphatase A